MHKYKIWIMVAIVLAVLGAVAGVDMADRKVARAPEASVPSAASSSQEASGTAMASSSSSSGGGLSVTFSTTTKEHYAGSSFSLDYPSSWMAALTPTFSLNDFGGKYQDGWMIPSGGAEIDIATTTVQSATAAKDVMTTELMSAKNVATTPQTIDGIVCTKAAYDSQYAAGQPSRDIALYCLRGTELWKIYFSYHAGDPAAQAHLADFAGVISSLRFLP